MAGTGDGGGVLHRTTVRAPGIITSFSIQPLYAFIYFQMLHACTVSDPQNGAFPNIWKEHLS